ncbi:MAG: hypothetical protein ABIV51_09295 [Saprospiraceae bacterium]
MRNDESGIIYYAGGIQHLTDARYFAARNFDWIGLQVDDTDPDSLKISEAKAIKEWIEGPSIAIEPGFVDSEELEFLIKEIKPAGILLDMASFQVQNHSIAMPRFQIVNDQTLGYVDQHTFEPQKINWIVSADLVAPLRQRIEKDSILLDIKEMHLDSILEFLKSGLVQGIFCTGEMEMATGIKSYDRLNDLLDKLEELGFKNE